MLVISGSYSVMVARSSPQSADPCASSTERGRVGVTPAVTCVSLSNCNTSQTVTMPKPKKYIALRREVGVKAAMALHARKKRKSENSEGDSVTPAVSLPSTHADASPHTHATNPETS